MTLHQALELVGCVVLTYLAARGLFVVLYNFFGRVLEYLDRNGRS